MHDGGNHYLTMLGQSAFRSFGRFNVIVLIFAFFCVVTFHKRDSNIKLINHKYWYAKDWLKYWQKFYKLYILSSTTTKNKYLNKLKALRPIKVIGVNERAFLLQCNPPPIHPYLPHHRLALQTFPFHVRNQILKKIFNC